ncbi:MAG: hypothetical protein K6G12_09225 [Lachnospiraceae bacterium]|nr:hypothetical protein [Lachnospiraceae bacterium]
MADDIIWRVQFVVAVLTLIASACVFVVQIRRINKYISVVPADDRLEMAALQEEYFGKDNSALNAEIIRKLLETWFVIFVGVQLMYEVFSEVYRHFALNLYRAVARSGGEYDYTSLYNLSHSFKYQGMLIALLLGVIMTAIFLDDKTLKLVAILAASIYLLSSTGLEMVTLSVLGQDIGIVWSSVIFHLIDTLGMIGLALYLRKRYHGV